MPQGRDDGWIGYDFTNYNRRQQEVLPPTPRPEPEPGPWHKITVIFGVTIIGLGFLSLVFGWNLNLVVGILIGIVPCILYCLHRQMKKHRVY